MRRVAEIELFCSVLREILDGVLLPNVGIRRQTLLIVRGEVAAGHRHKLQQGKF